MANIKGAIQGYVETVDELTKDKEARYVEVAGPSIEEFRKLL